MSKHRCDLLILNRDSFRNGLLLPFMVDDLLEQNLQATFSETSLFLDDLLVLIDFEVAILLLHGDEVLLSMRSDLGTRSGSNEILDLAPVFAKESDGLQKLLMLVICPATSDN